MKALKYLSIVLLFVLAVASVIGVTFNTLPSIDTDATTSFVISQIAPDAPGLGVTYSIAAEDATKVNCEIADNANLQLTPAVTFRSGTSTCTVRTTNTTSGAAEDDVLTITVARVNRLAITDVNFNGADSDNINTETVVVAGQTYTIVDGGSVDVYPGKTLTVKVEGENLWPESFSRDEHEIRDVEVEAELDGIGDIDNEDETETLNDLDPGDNDDVSFTFTFPQLLGRDNGDLTLTLTGRDRDGTSYTHRIRFTVSIKKKSHELKLVSSLVPSTLSCNRNGEIDVTVTNLGTNDEDVQLLIKNDQLNLKFFETFELTEAEDEEDEDAVFKQSYTFSVPSTTAPGTYPVKVSAFYQGEQREATQTLSLIVQACEQQTRQVSDVEATPAVPKKPAETPKQTVEVVTQPVVPSSVGSQVVAQPVVASRVPTSKESTTLTTGVVAMIVGAAVLLVLVVILVAVLVRRP